MLTRLLAFVFLAFIQATFVVLIGPAVPALAAPGAISDAANERSQRADLAKPNAILRVPEHGFWV